jgi:(E)-4-hydroxy-3-methylbut-2-enyl-diphosphate synthase
MNTNVSSIIRNPTRAVHIGSVTIGGGHPIVVQSMCATKTTDIEATAAQVEQLRAAGAGVVRIAADTKRDCQALAEIRRHTRDCPNFRAPGACPNFRVSENGTVPFSPSPLSPGVDENGTVPFAPPNLSVDLQENYRLAADVAPSVDKIRYNPGHLYHFEREKPWQDKVRFLVDVAGQHNCALRVGVNCGSVDPAIIEQFDQHDQIGPMLASALEHCELLDRLGFTRYCVSLKDSDPARVVEVNRRFAAERPDVPLHLGVTEAGMPPEGILKSRLAFEQLLSAGIGDTLRVSLTVPIARKHEEVLAGRQIIADVLAGRILGRDRPDFRAPGDCPDFRETKMGLSPLPLMREEYYRRAEKDLKKGLEIISCPSCSRVENDAFCELAEKVREAARYAAAYPITIAVMGCRVNGPGETDHADLGLWCGKNVVNLKRGSTILGSFSYEEIIARLKAELDAIIFTRKCSRS